MRIIYLSWSQFKTNLITKGFSIYYEVLGESPTINGYRVFAIDGALILWATEVLSPEDITDFETNYKSTANSNLNPQTYIDGQATRRLHVRDKTLDDILIALGGQTTTGIPVQFTNIAPGGKKPKKKATIATAQKVLMIDASVPTGKKWYLTSWDGSGQGKALYEIYQYDTTGATQGLIDELDSLTGWTKGDKIDSFVLDTVEKISGTASFRIVCTHRNPTEKGRLIKSFSPTLDLTTIDELVIYAKGSSSGKTITLKIFQGANSYIWSDQFILTGWHRYSFPMDEVLSLTPNAVDKIEIWIQAGGFKYTANETVWVDYLGTLINVYQETIDYFFSGAYIPFQHFFPTAIPINENQQVRIRVTNLDASSLEYEVGFNGREVNI